ncbi:Detected protein of confused Function [Hibiscus syriacus]|uniref:Detected protein of confused Function n=1 Tax=Hibiscus syriacus TaxID=106335 RepID=A0A6A3BYA5_HIBSY|nr:Detected protein of confused Function [Hibiscus syriacus]
MRMSYSPAAHLFSFLVQWDFHLAGGALGLKQRAWKGIVEEKLTDVDFEREEECGICMEMDSKILLPNFYHAMCLNCYHERRTRSRSCPFCRDSFKRVNSGDLWVYTDSRDVIDMATVTRENLRRLFIPEYFHLVDSVNDHARVIVGCCLR